MKVEVAAIVWLCSTKNALLDLNIFLSGGSLAYVKCNAKMDCERAKCMQIYACLDVARPV